MRKIGTETARKAGEACSLSVVGHLDAATLERTDAAWLRAQERYRAKAPCHPAWSLNWRWANRDRGDRRTAVLGLMDGDRLQALAAYSLNHRSSLPENEGRPSLCLEYLAAAPWNRTAALRALGASPIFQGVGLAMVRAVVRMSLARGYEGRVSVFPILGAGAFYRDACGMAPTVEMATDGPTEWYELTPKAAADLLSMP